jgi:HlyD family secretion protein
MDRGRTRHHPEADIMTTTSTTTRTDITDLLAVGPPRRRWSRAIRWPLGVAGVAVITLAAVMAMRSSGVVAPTFATEAVVRGDLEVQVSATGNLQPTNTVEVGSELSGLVDTVFVDENDTVKKGQELARLDTSKLRDQITRSEAALASAEARLTQASATVKETAANLDRLQEVSRLSGGKVPSKAELETGEASLARALGERAAATAAVTEAGAALSSDRTNLSKASIRSPINGIVLTRAVEPGQAVAASLQVATLFTIAEDLRQMELEVDVDEADVGRVQDGQHATFTVDAYPSRTYSAEVIRVAYGSTTSGEVVSYAAVLTVKNDDLSLRPGMTASADIASASVRGALLVPNAALRFTPSAAPAESGGIVRNLMPRPPPERTRPTEAASTNGSHKQLWVLRNDVPVAVPVTVGLTNGQLTEIVSGDLGEGTQVITEALGAQQ